MSNPDRPIHSAFRGQGNSCAMLGSPFMGRLMPLVGARLEPTSAVARRVLDWPGDVGPGGQSVPLRLAGALHGLVLDRLDADLAAVYPPNTASDDALWAAVDAALHRHEARLMAWLDQAPQTNEVRRAAAILPAIWWVLSQLDLPDPTVSLSELGASAGLNMTMDRFALDIAGTRHGPADSPVCLAPDWTGPVPAPHRIDVVERGGVDLHPIDPRIPAEALRLLAYLWPDQPHRRDLTLGAIALADTPPDPGDAADWLAARLAAPRKGQVHIVYHTIAWQYFPPETRAACEAALQAAGRRATPEAPLAHIALEADGDATGAGLRARIWPAADGTDAPRLLARADYHGRWIDWRD